MVAKRRRSPNWNSLVWGPFVCAATTMLPLCALAEETEKPAASDPAAASETAPPAATEAAKEASPAASTTTTTMSAKALFERLDANHDGKLTTDEVPAEKRRLLARILKAADRDGDGALTADELAAGLERQKPERVREEKSPAQLEGGLPDPEVLFARLDVNGDGKITNAEIPDDARERFGKLLERADKDGDGALTKQELTEGIQAYAKEIRAMIDDAQSPRGVFRYLDANGDGKITMDEAPVDKAPNFEKLKAKFDADGDGALNEEEFIKGLTRVRQLQSMGILPKPDGEIDATKSRAAKKTSASDAEKSSGDKEKDNAGNDASPSEASSKDAAKKDASTNEAPAAGKIVERLKQMDRDHDGKLSLEEFGNRKRLFEALDTNHDGFLDRDELKAQIGKLRDRIEAAKQ